MAYIYAYAPDEDDCSTIGLVGALLDEDAEFNIKAGEFGELTFTHPVDPYGKWKALVNGAILKTMVPMRLCPGLKENGTYIATVDKYTVAATATKLQRYIYSGNGLTKNGKKQDGKKKKLLKVGQAVTVTGVADASDGNSRYKVKLGKVSGWMERAGLTLTQQNVPVEQDEGGLESTEPSYAVRQQLFRIYEVNPQTSDSDPGSIEVHARRIVYDLLGNISTYKNNGSLTCRTACENVLSSAVMPHDFTIFTDIGDSHVGFDAMNINPIAALVDPENGVTARWGAEIVCDDYEIYVLHRAGLDRGVHIEYAKNLIGVDLSEDVSNVATAIRPAGEDKNGNVLYIGGSVVNGQHVYNGGTQLPTGYHFYIKPDGTVNGAIVVRANYDNESLPRIHFEEVSDAKVGKNKNDVTVAIARQMLVERAVELFEGGCDVPEISMSVDFVMLGDTAEYAQYKHLEPLFVYDTVHIHDRRVGVRADIDLTELTWLVRPERVSAAEFGALKDMTASISGWQISSVSGAKILPGTVGAGQIGDDTISARAIQADSVNADALQANSVTAGKVAAGAITAEKLDAGAVTADKLAANSVTAAKIDANSVNAINAKLGTASIARAEISSADIGFAQIKDANVEQLIAQDAVTGRYYIRKLQVDNAQMVQATVGALVIKASDGKYYRLDFDDEGNLTPTEVTLTEGEITAGETADGRGSIIETDLTVTDLAASNMKAINALIDKIDAARINVDQLFARQAFTDELHTSMITDDDFVSIVVGVGNAQSAADAAQQDIDNLSVGGRNFILSSEAVRAHTRTMSTVYTYGWQPDNPWLLSDYAKGILNAAGYPETLMLSFEARSSQAGAKLLMGVKSDTSQTGYEAKNVALKTAWDKYTATLTRKNNSDSYVLTRVWPMVSPVSAGEVTIEVRRMKLELGNRSTDWTPAPEDTDADITAAQTTADGAASAASAAQATADSKADPMTATAHGREIVVSDSADAAIGGLVIYGRSEQTQAPTGKNLLPAYNLYGIRTVNGITFAPLPDGGFRVTGTSTAVATYQLHYNYNLLNIPAGTYRFLVTGSGTGFGGTNVALQLYTNTGSGLVSRIVTIDGTYTITGDTTADYARLRVETGKTVDCVIHPMMMLASVADTTYEPRSGGVANPSPALPQPIRSVGMTCGLNLLRGMRRDRGLSNGITYSDPGDGGIHIEGTAVADSYSDSTVSSPDVLIDGNYPLLPAGQYIVSEPETSLVKWLLSAWKATDYSRAMNNTSYAAGTAQNQRRFVLTEPCYVLFRAAVASGTTVNVTMYPAIYRDETYVEGIVPPAWEPYSAGQPQGTQITLTCADDAQGTNAAHTTLPTPNGLPGIAVSSGGNYTDADGQQWICDTIDLAAGTYTKRCGTIPGYDGETIPGAYLSTTGGLTAGATVVYALATPVVTPLTEAQLTALRSIRTRAGVTVLTNDAGADMDLTYATRTGGGSYVEGVRQGLDDGIGKAQGAADAAQVTADAAREDFRRVVRIDTEGLHVGDNQTSNEVMIDSESVNVVLGGRKYSKFAGDYVQFGDYQLRRSVDGGLVFKKA